MFTVIQDLVATILDLASKAEALLARNEALSRTVEQQHTMIAELEGQMQGRVARYSFLQSIELYPSIPKAAEALRFYHGQDGFFGGRILEPDTRGTQVRLQVFWRDDDPPSSWVTAHIRNEQLPDGIRHVIIPPSLQNTILLYTERDIQPA